MSIRSHTDTVLCDSDLVRGLLQERRLSQVELARLAFAATARKPLDKVTREDAESMRRTVLRLLQGHRIHRDTAHLFAQVLAVPVRRLVLPDLQGGDSIHELLSLMEEHDRHGEFERACELGEQWREFFPETSSDRGAVCVMLATVYDHAQQWDRAIERLNEWLDQPHSIIDETILRGRYQRAVVRRTRLEDILNRTMRKLPAARLRALIQPIKEDLLYVQSRSGTGMQISVSHQLAVLQLLSGHFRKALQSFTECLRRRQQEQQAAPEERDGHRLAYEYRRIAQCQAFLGLSATEALNEATRIAEETQHLRLLQEIERDRHAWQQLHPNQPVSR